MSDSLPMMNWFLRLPPPLAANTWLDGAACPWCGKANKTVSYGEQNLCGDCGRPFWFGVPIWSQDGALMTWVDPTWKEKLLLESNPNLLPVWSPTDHIKQIRFNQVTKKSELGTA